MKKQVAIITDDKHFFHTARQIRGLCRLAWFSWFLQI